MLRIVLLFFVLGMWSLKAQSFKENSMIELGYTHFNGNYFKIGAKYFFDDTFSSVGLSANLGYLKDKMVVIPEIAFTQYLTKESWKNFNSDHFIFAQVALSPKTLTPKIGWSFTSFLEISTGYGINLNTSNYYNTKGFRLDACVAIPLDLKIM